MGNMERSLWKKYFKYLVSAVILLLGAGVSLVYIGKEYLAYAVIVVVCLSLFCIRKKYLVYVVIVLIVLFGACLSLCYLHCVTSGRCEYIPLIGYIGEDGDSFRTAGVIFGAALLLANMYLVTVRIRRTEKTNDLAMFHQGITMLNTRNAITQIGGVEYLHRLAKEAKENKQQREEVLRVFCAFLKHVPSSKEDGSRRTKDLILRKMFINKGDREIYPNKKMELQEAELPGACLCYADLSEANLQGANLVGANLQYAGSEDAGLKDANLEMATLLGADFRWAKLEGVKLKDAILNYAIIPMTEADALPGRSSVTFNGGGEYNDGVSGGFDIIWMQDNTSFQWRTRMYSKQELQDALESELAKLQNESAKQRNELLCGVVRLVIDRLSKR